MKLPALSVSSLLFPLLLTSVCVNPLACLCTRHHQADNECTDHALLLFRCCERPRQAIDSPIHGRHLGYHHRRLTTPGLASDVSCTPRLLNPELPSRPEGKVVKKIQTSSLCSSHQVNNQTNLKVVKDGIYIQPREFSFTRCFPATSIASQASAAAPSSGFRRKARWTAPNNNTSRLRHHISEPALHQQQPTLPRSKHQSKSQEIPAMSEAIRQHARLVVLWL